MKEKDCIIATNRVKISIAKQVLADVTSAKNYGVTPEELKDLMIKLGAIEDRLFAMVNHLVS